MHPFSGPNPPHAYYYTMYHLIVTYTEGGPYTEKYPATITTAVSTEEDTTVTEATATEETTTEGITTEAMTTVTFTEGTTTFEMTTAESMATQEMMTTETVTFTEETTAIEATTTEAMTTFPGIFVPAEQAAANGPVKEDVVISKVDGVEKPGFQGQRDKDESSDESSDSDSEEDESDANDASETTEIDSSGNYSIADIGEDAGGTQGIYTHSKNIIIVTYLCPQIMRSTPLIVCCNNCIW